MVGFPKVDPFLLKEAPTMWLARLLIRGGIFDLMLPLNSTKINLFRSAMVGNYPLMLRRNSREHDNQAFLSNPIPAQPWSVSAINSRDPLSELISAHKRFTPQPDCPCTGKIS